MTDPCGFYDTVRHFNLSNPSSYSISRNQPPPPPWTVLFLDGAGITVYEHLAGAIIGEEDGECPDSPCEGAVS